MTPLNPLNTYNSFVRKFLQKTIGLSVVFVWVITFGVSPQLSAQLATLSNQDSSSSYSLAAGDQIKISVYEEIDLSFDELRIGDNGVITYPFLGEIRVSGLSIAELEATIRTGLVDGEFLIQPEVTVSILEYRPFYIDGEVNSPGGYPFEPGLTLRKAVTLAGGFTERASRSKISIISGGSYNADPESIQQNMTLEAIVKPGDIITVAQRFF